MYCREGHRHSPSQHDCFRRVTESFNPSFLACALAYVTAVSQEAGIPYSQLASQAHLTPENHSSIDPPFHRAPGFQVSHPFRRGWSQVESAQEYILPCVDRCIGIIFHGLYQEILPHRFHEVEVSSSPLFETEIADSLRTAQIPQSRL